MSPAGALFAVLLLASFVHDARAQAEPDAASAALAVVPSAGAAPQAPEAAAASGTGAAVVGAEPLEAHEGVAGTESVAVELQADGVVTPPSDGVPPEAAQAGAEDGTAPGSPPPGTAAAGRLTPTAVKVGGEGTPASSIPEHGTAASEADAPAGTATAPRADLAPTAGEQMLYDRLLGRDQGGGVASGENATPAVGLEVAPPTVPAWLWVVGVLGGVGLLLLRSRTMRALSGPKAIEVLTRTALGKDGSLAVVEVAEADGEKRRLLVGFGGGAPRLVADLGRPFPDDGAGADDVATIDALRVRAESSAPRAASSRLGPVDGSRSNATSAWARAVRDADGSVLPPQTGGGRLERRHDLIQEVLAERGDDDPHEVNG